MKVKEESEIDGLKLNIQKTKIMASTADGDCSHEIKRCLLLGRKVMTNLDDILTSRLAGKYSVALCPEDTEMDLLST